LLAKEKKRTGSWASQKPTVSAIALIGRRSLTFLQTTIRFSGQTFSDSQRYIYYGKNYIWPYLVALGLSR